MDYTNITTEIKDGIFLIKINRPKQLNALNKATFEDIETAMNEVYTNMDIKAVIFTGEGEKAFVAGADIKEFADFNPAQGKELSENGMRIFQIIEDCPKVVIAAVNGFALGGGCELAMSCHIRVASENALFGQPEIKLGVTPGYAGTQRLTRYVGKSKAMELLLTADMISAEQAKEFGLVSYVTETGKAVEKATDLIKKILKNSTVAGSAIINCVNSYYDKNKDGFDVEATEFGNCFATGDFKEGTTAFIEKRKANFPGN